MDGELPAIQFRPAWPPAAGTALWHEDGSWWELTTPRAVLAARELDDVPRFLAEAEQHALDGGWAYVAVSYSAARAFDGALPTEEGVCYALVALYDDNPHRWDEICDPTTPAVQTRREWTQRDYEVAFARAKTYIERGDTYQVNLSYRLSLESAADLWEIWRSRVAVRKPQYASYFSAAEVTLASQSPELFFERTGSKIVSRPMKGTRPRRAATEELTRDEKERAENLMIVDMIRNDLGRIAHPGSVHVPRLFQVEPHGEVLQMTSTVAAQTDADLVGIFQAMFPCASIVGAPKRRTMEIIRELEPSPRGFYCGAIGVIRPGGDCRFSVAIRTWEDVHRLKRLGIGSGVVWDSGVDREWHECELKADSVIRTTQNALGWFETIAREPDGTLRHLDRHVKRLCTTVRAHGGELAEVACLEALAGLPPASGVERVRLVYRIGLQITASGTLTVSAEPYSRPLTLRAGVAVTPVNSQDTTLRSKWTRRDVYDRARQEVPKGCDEVILINERGELTECSNGNLVVEIDGKLLTPPVDCGLLPGIQRAIEIETGHISEAVLVREDLDRCTRAWRINSLGGWIPLDLITRSSAE